MGRVTIPNCRGYHSVQTTCLQTRDDLTPLWVARTIEGGDRYGAWHTAAAQPGGRFGPSGRVPPPPPQSHLHPCSCPCRRLALTATLGASYGQGPCGKRLFIPCPWAHTPPWLVLTPLRWWGKGFVVLGEQAPWLRALSKRAALASFECVCEAAEAHRVSVTGWIDTRSRLSFPHIEGGRGPFVYIWVTKALR